MIKSIVNKIKNKPKKKGLLFLFISVNRKRKRKINCEYIQCFCRKDPHKKIINDPLIVNSF